MPTTPRTEESIFAEALDKRSPYELALFLDGACGSDAALRARIEKLLESHEHAGSFLRKGMATTMDRPVAERPGTLIGPYKLMEQIGEGGMGMVFVAEQQHPVRRRVALKIIKPGMDSRQVIARFEAERQALALMDHQHIAKVYDAGTTESGRPYFVMELVHGVPITDYCDANHLTPRQRLELFVPVCQAVQHAHQKGIIHRDLKPSNVLVTMYDDKPVPKVIDFGVAKAIEQRLTEKTVYTQFGTLVGTFEYMSPEQAEMNAFGVDTRSDIYALGVLLYELLTGSTPLERQRLREAAFGEIVRLIKEEEPERPSVRLSTSGQLAKVAAARQTEPAKLSRLLRGELDWVVLRCLEKDRSRRYDTASGLAKDVERYLKDEPVEARPPSAAYRLRKLLRRNRAAVVTATVVAFALVLGTAVSAWQALRATRAEAHAREVHGLVQLELDRTLKAEKRASEEKANAQASLRFLLDDVLAQADPFRRPDRDPTVRSLMDRATSRLEENKQIPPLVEASIRDALGRVYCGLGDADKAVHHLEQAHRLQRQYAPADDPANLDTALNLAKSYGQHGDFAKAQSMLQSVFDRSRQILGEDDPITLRAMYAVARVYLSQDDLSGAELLLSKGLTASRQRAEPNPLTNEFRFGLGMTYGLMGRYAEAEALFDQALKGQRAVGDDENPAALYVRCQRSALFVEMKRFPEAEHEAKETYRLSRQVLGEQNPLTTVSESILAHVYLAQGKRSEAEPLLRRLQKAAQANQVLSSVLFSGFGELGRDLLQQREFADAEPFLRLSVRQAETALRESWLRSSLVSALGGCLLGQKQYAEAEPLLLKGFEGLQKLEEKTLQPLTPGRRRIEAAKLTENVDWLVRLYEETDKPQEAAKWRKCLAELARKE
jgi:serine/threonine protein kinase